MGCPLASLPKWSPTPICPLVALIKWMKKIIKNGWNISNGWEKKMLIGSDWCWTCVLGLNFFLNEKWKGRSILDPLVLLILGLFRSSKLASLYSCPNLGGLEENLNSQWWQLKFGSFHGQPPYLFFFPPFFLFLFSFLLICYKRHCPKTTMTKNKKPWRRSSFSFFFFFYAITIVVATSCR